MVLEIECQGRAVGTQQKYYFRGIPCEKAFDRDPEKYLAGAEKKQW